MRPQLDTISTLLDQGAPDSAVRMLRSSWEPDMPAEDRIPVYCMWIRGLCGMGDLDAALVLARRAAQEFPREPDILIALGNVLDAHGELEDAHNTFALAADMDEGNPLAHYNLGAVLERLDREQEARDQYEKSMSVFALTEAATALGALLRRHGQIEEAVDVYDRFLEEDPMNVEVLVEHGICLSDLEHYESALSRFESALMLEPSHPAALYNKAITQYRAGRQKQALATLRSAWEAEPDNPLTMAVLGGWFVTDPDHTDKALGLLYGAVDRIEELQAEGELNPAYAKLVIEEVFEAMWVDGRRAEARQLARTAGRYDWITPHMFDTLAWADADPSSCNSTFAVSARAEAEDQRPEHWPEDAEGYTTDLTVVAADESEARALTIEYLRGLEPAGVMAFDVNVVRRLNRTDSEETPRPRGVVDVQATRAYFRGG